jgi:hypothetical protein
VLAQIGTIERAVQEISDALSGARPHPPGSKQLVEDEMDDLIFGREEIGPVAKLPPSQGSARIHVDETRLDELRVDVEGDVDASAITRERELKWDPWLGLCNEPLCLQRCPTESRRSLGDEDVQIF